MAPKSKMSIASKRPAPPIIRQPISDSSLMYIPEDVMEGYQDRIETGIEWTLLEEGARHHKNICKRQDLPKVTFSDAFNNKISKSIVNGFLDDESGISLEQQWDFVLPTTLWDNEKFASDEAKVCFHSANCITDDVLKLIKKAVKFSDRNILKNELKNVNVLRINDAQMTELDEGLTKYRKLISLNLCGNYLSDLNTACLPPSLKSIELQSNRITDVSRFAESMPFDLLYLGLARNFISEHVDSLKLLPYNLTVLDLADNDIYHLDDVLEAVARLANLTALQLSGNPCAVSAGYARATLIKLRRLKWLDCREILPTDRPIEPSDVHPDDLRSAYFHFTVFRIMSAPQPPKAEKGSNTAFHIELEVPLLDVVRRRFLLYRRNESLIDILPPPEDEEWPVLMPAPRPSAAEIPAGDEATSVATDIFSHMVMKNTREIHNYTTFESNRVQWNKMMTFQEPVMKVFCPDLFALRNTFRSVITVRLVFTNTYVPAKATKTDKKSAHILRPPGEMRVTVATIRCALNAPDWSQPSQHFHWDDSMGTEDAIHWGDGDLTVIQYSQTPVKVTKAKAEATDTGLRQAQPENLTCHFGFGIDTLRVS